MAARPLLLIDVDGVVSLFDWTTVRGPRVLVDGIPHHLSAAAAAALRELTPHFEMVWCTGWEERAEEHLPGLLGLEGGWPHLELDRGGPGRTTPGHWKLAAIDAFAGPARPLAWIDDAHGDAGRAWAARRPGSHAARPHRPARRPDLGPRRRADRLGHPPEMRQGVVRGRW